MAWTLLVAAAIGLAAASSFVLVGTRFAGRGHGEDRRAARAFAVWWFGLAAFSGIHALEDVLGASGAATLQTFVVTRVVALLIAGSAFGGLCFYVAFVRTGDTRWSPRIAVYYFVVTAVVLWGLLARPQAGIRVDAWDATLAYAPESLPTSVVLSSLFTLPAIAAGLAYLTLARSALGAAQRRRVLVVGSAIVVWIVAITLTRFAQDDVSELLARPVAGMAVALAVAWATRAPPTREQEAARIADLDAKRARLLELV